MRVAIIDYGMGNIASVEKALTYLGIESIVTKDEDEIEKARCIILPGVGAFRQGMNNLSDAGLIRILNEQVISHKKPFLGICLGLQLIAQKGTEPTVCDGLGWIEGEVVKMIQPDRMVPHLGWNEIEARPDSVLGAYSGKDFYFIHSYHFKVTNESDIIARVDYGDKYVAAVSKGNIHAVQFHPEKSQKVGLEFIKMFMEQYA